MQTVTHEGMAFDDFLQRFREQPFELINGEAIPLSPNEIRHNLIALEVASLLRDFLKVHAIGRAFIETPFTLSNNPNWVKDALVPDVMFIAADRLTPYQQNPNWDEGAFRIVPDLVVEIDSPTDRTKVVLQKVVIYLESGVNTVWVIDPKRSTVSIYTDIEQPIVLSREQMLTAGEVLPGFEVRVDQLFQK